MNAKEAMRKSMSAPKINGGKLSPEAAMKIRKSASKVMYK